MKKIVALLALAALTGCTHIPASGCDNAWLVGEENVTYGMAIGVTDDCKLEVVNKWGKITYMD